ncbi:MAG: dTMP kinase [Proteobacteria bacterium]|nr:dTMP kinase [Pseudomonadota bacterium]
MLITFEGIEGAGKSTQIKLLEKYFKKIKRDFLVIREPGGTPISEKIREILLNPDHNLENETELFLFLASRAELVKKVIKPALKKNKIVICDRFIDSTMAYQGYGRGISKSFISLLNSYIVKDIKIQRTYLLDYAPEAFGIRIKDRTMDRIENNNIDFHKRVREGFLKIAKKNKRRFLVINALEPIEIIHKKIIEDLTNFI